MSFSRLQHARELFADFDGNGAHEDRPALRVDGLDFVDDGVELLAPGLVNRIVRVLARNGRFVGMTSTPSL